MKSIKIPANQRRLAKLLVDAGEEFWVPQDEAERMAAFLAKRGVLAVCAETVVCDEPFVASTAQEIRTRLRCLARGQR